MLRYHQSCYLYAPWRRVFPSPVPRTTQMLVESANPRMPVLFGGSGVLIRCSMPYGRTNDDPRGLWADCVVATAKATYTLDGLTVPARYDHWGIEHSVIKPAIPGMDRHSAALWAITNMTGRIINFRHNGHTLALVGTKAAICSLAFDLGPYSLYTARPCVITDELAQRHEFDATLAHLQYDYKLAALFHRY